jgi:hypothetical protein
MRRKWSERRKRRKEKRKKEKKRKINILINGVVDLEKNKE